MTMTTDELRINAAQEAERIAAFVRSELQAAGRSRVVLGLSGGLDSAVVSYLCVLAAGPGQVCPVIMPYRTSTPDSVAHARMVCDALGLDPITSEISACVDAFEQTLGGSDARQLGNVMARTRMILLYAQSDRLGALVAGTGNRTEAMLGYTTLHGDSACAFGPIRHLYKSQVRQLARYLNVPTEIIDKPPSADLWPGQTDEGELGFAYDQVDRLLFQLHDKGRTDDELAAAGFDPSLVTKVKNLVARSEFKRRMPHSLLGPR